VGKSEERDRVRDPYPYLRVSARPGKPGSGPPAIAALVLGIFYRRARRLDHNFEPGRAIDLDEWKKRDLLVNIGEKRMSEPLDDTATWIRRCWA